MFLLSETDISKFHDTSKMPHTHTHTHTHYTLTIHTAAKMTNHHKTTADKLLSQRQAEADRQKLARKRSSQHAGQESAASTVQRAERGGQKTAPS